tara:strand:- start:1637 stop:1915 length:279 start_codon:yes stop_codon:yes gene_type:complete
MFSKLFPWAFFFNWMPYPRRFWVLGPFTQLFYVPLYRTYEAAVVSYYKKQLRELDFWYAMSEASKELIRRRELAREQGIGPADPEYPNLHDV